MATGNEVTCAVQASVSQFGLSVPLYALSLNTYFLLAVKHNFDITKVRWVEKWCHIIPIGISLLLSILLLAYKEYGVDGKLPAQRMYWLVCLEPENLKQVHF